MENKGKNLSSKILSIVSIVLSLSAYVFPPALMIILLPIALILAIFSLLEARKEKISLHLSLLAIVLPFAMFIFIRWMLSVEFNKIDEDAYNKMYEVNQNLYQQTSEILKK